MWSPSSLGLTFFTFVFSAPLVAYATTTRPSPSSYCTSSQVLTTFGDGRLVCDPYNVLPNSCRSLSSSPSPTTVFTVNPQNGACSLGTLGANMGYASPAVTCLQCQKPTCADSTMVLNPWTITCYGPGSADDNDPNACGATGNACPADPNGVGSSTCTAGVCSFNCPDYYQLDAATTPQCIQTLSYCPYDQTLVFYDNRGPFQCAYPQDISDGFSRYCGTSPSGSAAPNTLYLINRNSNPPTCATTVLSPTTGYPNDSSCQDTYGCFVPVCPNGELLNPYTLGCFVAGTDSDNSPTFCSAQGTNCITDPNGTAACTQGVCSLTCSSPYTLNAAKTACINLSSDVKNCGGEGTQCATDPQGQPVCSQGVCSISCTSPYTINDAGTTCFNLAPSPGAYCDSSQTLLKSYGSYYCANAQVFCGVPNPGFGPSMFLVEQGFPCFNGVLSVGNGYPTGDNCVRLTDQGTNGGSCNFPSCGAGLSLNPYAVTCFEPNSKGDSDSQFCGAAGVQCPSNPNGATLCINGVCRVSCDPPYTVNTAHTTCLALSTDIQNCGAEGYKCPTSPNAECTNGVCSLNCSAPYLFNTARTACYNPQTDPNNCGAEGTICPTIPNAAATCTSGVCGTTLACPPPTSLNAAQTACLSLSTDVANCGRERNQCPSPSNGNPTCASGVCGITCNAPYTPNSAKTSCINFQGDVNNCGTEGNLCSTSDPNGIASCSAGVCNPLSDCTSPYGLNQAGTACVNLAPSPTAYCDPGNTLLKAYGSFYCGSSQSFCGIPDPGFGPTRFLVNQGYPCYDGGVLNVGSGYPTSNNCIRLTNQGGNGGSCNSPSCGAGLSLNPYSVKCFYPTGNGDRDPGFCGAAGVQCASDANGSSACTNGVCTLTCTAPYVSANGACVIPATNGKACSVDASCASSYCASGKCVDSSMSGPKVAVPGHCHTDYNCGSAALCYGNGQPNSSDSFVCVRTSSSITSTRCATTSQCPSGAGCRNGACYPYKNAYDPCQIDSDCAGGSCPSPALVCAPSSTLSPSSASASSTASSTVASTVSSTTSLATSSTRSSSSTTSTFSPTTTSKATSSSASTTTSSVSATSTSLAAVGASCSTDYGCSSSWCLSGKCANSSNSGPKVAVPGHCHTDYNCGSSALCFGNGQAQSSDSYACVRTNTTITSTKCSSAANCPNGAGCRSGACFTLKNPFDPCLQNSDCSTGTCSTSSLTCAISPPGGSCLSNSDCQSGTTCKSNLCVAQLANGAVCSSDYSCLSGYCVNKCLDSSTSGPKIAVPGHCHTDYNCGSSAQCFGNGQPNQSDSFACARINTSVTAIKCSSSSSCPANAGCRNGACYTYKGAYDPCVNATDCSSGVCLASSLTCAPGSATSTSTTSQSSSTTSLRASSTSSSSTTSSRSSTATSATSTLTRLSSTSTSSATPSSSKTSTSSSAATSTSGLSRSTTTSSSTTSSINSSTTIGVTSSSSTRSTTTSSSPSVSATPLAGNGKACTGDAACQSSYCVSGKCVDSSTSGPKIAVPGHCHTDYNCGSAALCFGNGKSNSSDSFACVKTSSAVTSTKCTSAGSCPSNAGCRNGACYPLKQSYDPCTQNSDCASGTCLNPSLICV